MGIDLFHYLQGLSERTVNLLLRQAVSFTTAMVHLSLFWGDIPPPLWPLLLFQATVYAPLIHRIPHFYHHPSDALLVDATVYGFCIGIWGLNPFLATCFISSANIISMAAGGPRFCLKAFLLTIATIPIGAAFHGWTFRLQVPVSTTVIASLGLLLFMTALGLRIYSINTRLRHTRNELRQQKQELLDLNQLALAVNSRLEVDEIMRVLMGALTQHYPFETLYILGWNHDHTQLTVLGAYGEVITAEEKSTFSHLVFDPVIDKDSIFIRGLTDVRVLHIPDIDPIRVRQGSEIDQRIFDLKPARSIAYFPIFVEDRIIGGACFANYQSPFQLRHEDIQLIERSLVQVGTALRNSALIQRMEWAIAEAEEARMQAEASEQAKGRFLANVSHEIRTPLTAIMGYSEALQEKDSTEEERQQFVRQILRSGNHLLNMINDILDISKIEASKVDIEFVDFDLIEILCDIESFLALRTKEKALSMAIEADFPIPQTLYNDPTRLKQILLNLCNNAVKFTHSGEIVIHLRMRTQTDLVISIRDTGIGVAEQDQSRIFNAFDQADTSTTRLFGGTGLGLYISKNLAVLMGGDLTLTSEPGRGSCFQLCVPIGTPARNYIHNLTEFEATRRRIRDARNQTAVPQIQGRVLLAEDNPQNQRLISRLIRQTGMSVDSVANGKAAVEAAENKHYTLILMDMQMPVMDGLEATRIIRERKVPSPIIAFTANVMRHQVAQYKALGIADTLEKPINRDQLFSLLQKFSRKPERKAVSVLIAEDDEVNQMILLRHVNKANPDAETTLAVNGAQALELADKKTFDLVLIDVQMPVMDGLTAVRQLRAKGFKNPIFTVSGNIDEEAVRSSRDAGADGHLGKPFNKEKIADILNRTLS